jgi:Phycobilisome protein
MHPQIEEVFDDTENRYLKIEELKLIAQYVGSIPERLTIYRNLRDREIDIMQSVANQLQAELPQAPEADLERCLKNALLLLRHCAMAMLIDEEEIIRDRFLNWVLPTVEVYETQAIDSRLHQILNQRLTQLLGKHMHLLNPMLLKAQAALSAGTSESTNGVAIGW